MIRRRRDCLVREFYHPVLAVQSRASLRDPAEDGREALDRCARGGRQVAGNPAQENQHEHCRRNHQFWSHGRPY